MTAEVGVMNRLGVALAADSAVSIGREANKIWTSADKLFHLSRSAPVGVMVYGNANFVGIPWETVVKEFRSDLSETRFARLEEYGERFFRFLSRNRTLFPLAAQSQVVSELVTGLLHHLRHESQARLTKEAEERDGLDERDIPPILDEVVSARLKLIRSQPRLRGYGDQAVAEVRRRYGPAVRRIRGEVFGTLPMRSGTSRKVASVALEMLCRHYMGPSQSGVVIAGFGESEAMPSLFSYDVEEMGANRPRRILSQKQHITLENSAAIVPFAQQEIVHAFLQGIDLDLEAHMRDSTSTLFTGAVDSILEAVRNVDQTLASSLNQAVRPEVRRVLKSLFEDWRNQQIFHWGPIVDIVSSLPKDELAAMAESLVNLTKFRRRITPERETVGGPIDVAVITKGDGFIWVNRKHYFEPALNPRVIARYNREG